MMTLLLGLLLWLARAQNKAGQFDALRRKTAQL